MSSSDRSPRAQGRLSVQAPLGVEIVVADGAFNIVGRGVTRFERDLDEGVYSVRWVAAERSRQWIVRVKGDAVEMVTGDTPGSTDSGWHSDRFEAAARRLLADIKPEAEAGILIVVLSRHGELRGDPLRTIRLRDLDGAVPRPARKSGLADPAEGWRASAYGVRPGLHVVTFETCERRLVQQVVYAPAGRWTVVLLTYAHAAIVERQKTDAHVRSRRGIDPAATTILSCSYDAGAERVGADLRTAEILLHHLRRRARPLEAEVAETLRADEADPFLRLYAAAAALALPGAPPDRLTSVMVESDGDDQRAIAAAREIHASLAMYEDWPDVRSLGWRCAGHSGWPDTLARLPMLEISWRWAAARSVSGRGAVKVEPTLADAAARADLSASPWLVVGAGGAGGAGAASAAAEPVEAAEDLLFSLSSSLGDFYSSPEQVRSRTGGELPLAAALDPTSLSRDTERIVRAVVSSGGVERWSAQGGRALHHLAASMGTPVSHLTPALRVAAEEVGAVLERSRSSDEGTWTGDPNKGAFGGASRRDGVALSLDSYEESTGIEFLALHLVVRTEDRRRPLEGPVTFHLHPTFPSSVQQARVVDGKAVMTCYAWGAFTVGAETADRRRLELDLAALDELPSWFRSR